MTIDLETLTIGHAGGTLLFELDAQRRERLLEGIDDIAGALHFEAVIADHERRVLANTPWLADPHLARVG
jgi:3-isopropylmalate/(R)-2-methylmalate dehydratase small subunit